MTSGRDIRAVLTAASSLSRLLEMGDALAGALPPGHRFEDDDWNVISWKGVRGRARELFLHFGEFRNVELRDVVKVYLLHCRAVRALSGATLLNKFRAVKALDQVILRDRSVLELSNDDFNEAQARLLGETRSVTHNRFVLPKHLTGFGRFLNGQLGVRISFIHTASMGPKHGASGTSAAQEAKLIPLEVLRDLLAAGQDEGLSVRDQFFRHSLLLLVASGFRLTELTTLPADCLVDQRGLVGLRYFSVKKGKFEIKPVASAFGPSIRAAVDHLQKFTASGRAAALKASNTKWTGSAQYDWSYILRSGEAAEYFVGRQLHAWTANPRNNMFNPAGAWFERDKAYVDVLQMLSDANGNHSEVARQLNTTSQVVVYLTWAQEAMHRGELPPNSQRNGAKLNHVMDSRYVTHSVLERLVGMQVKEKRLEMVQPYLREAQRLQLLGEVYPEPPYNARLEMTYARQYPAVIFSSDGKRLLEPHEALFVIEERALSHSRQVKVGAFTIVPANRLAHWLTGEARVRGTGSVTDSVFVRFGIKDPRTGQIAKFTSHDVRHWLNTMYLRGGLSNVEAALVMGHDPTVNATYDQRDFLEREAALKQAVREHRAIGHIPETYEVLFHEDVDAAEEYLMSVLRRYTLMPHGACSRNLRQDPCPNQLSCFADQHREDGGACMYLVVDAQAPGILSHLQALERQQDTLLTMLPASSPQAVHARWTRRNVQAFIERLEK